MLLRNEEATRTCKIARRERSELEISSFPFFDITIAAKISTIDSNDTNFNFK